MDIFEKDSSGDMASHSDKSISRRGFLKTAAAIGAALTVSPALDRRKRR